MIRLTKVLVPTDFSERPLRRWPTVRSWPAQMFADAQQGLEEAVPQIERDRQATELVPCLGEPHGEIVRFANERGIAAPCPVLTVRGK